MNENNMTGIHVNVQENEQKAPVFQTEINGVGITVTFATSAGERRTKETILELLTNAYENRLRSADC